METTNKPAPVKTIFGPCTIYKAGEFMGNIGKIECRSAEVWHAPYAQYPSALHVRYVKKGCRDARGYVDTWRPTTMILEGHGHPDPAGVFDGGKEFYDDSGETNMVKSAHSSFAPGWARDFDMLITKHVETTGAKVLADFRHKEDADA